MSEQICVCGHSKVAHEGHTHTGRGPEPSHCSQNCECQAYRLASPQPTPSMAKNTGSTSFVVPAVWPSPQLEAEMRRDAAVAREREGVNESIADCGCHIPALLERVRALEAALPTRKTIAETALAICQGFDVYDDQGGGIDLENPLGVEALAEILAHHLLGE